MEKAELDLLSLPPRNHKREHLITGKIYIQAYLFPGVIETCIARTMFFLYMWQYASIPASSLLFVFEGYTDGFYGYSQAELMQFHSGGQCVCFVTLVIIQWGKILAVRNRRLSILQADPITEKRRNPWLVLSMITSLVAAILVTEVPIIQFIFHTVPVPLQFWLIPIPFALGVLILDEIRKFAVREFPNGPLVKIAW
jgi:sodium/potassium-transporting ATPase subunit alpha